MHRLDDTYAAATVCASGRAVLFGHSVIVRCTVPSFKFRFELFRPTECLADSFSLCLCLCLCAFASLRFYLSPPVAICPPACHPTRILCSLSLSHHSIPFRPMVPQAQAFFEGLNATITAAPIGLFSALWADAGIQEVYGQRRLLQLSDSTGLHVLGSPNPSPSHNPANPANPAPPPPHAHTHHHHTNQLPINHQPPSTTQPPNPPPIDPRNRPPGCFWSRATGSN